MTSDTITGSSDQVVTFNAKLAEAAAAESSLAAADPVQESAVQERAVQELADRELADSDHDDTLELTGNWGYRRRDERPVLPSSTRDDTDAGWGERSPDNDSWLRDQRPPHWD